MVGKTIWNKQHNAKGIVVNESVRYCSACNRNHSCLIVKWEDGKTTKPCTMGIKQFNDELQIV